MSEEKSIENVEIETLRIKVKDLEEEIKQKDETLKQYEEAYKQKVEQYNRLFALFANNIDFYIMGQKSNQ